MLNKLIKIFFGALLLIGWTSCDTDSSTAGSSILDDDDIIRVCADTFNLRSALIQCDSIVSWPDSFMLGELSNSYGTMHAEVLTQFACPEGFCYPISDSTRIDSIEIALCYRSYFGDGMSPLSIDVKRMDLQTFDYSSTYATNVAVSDYVSSSSASILSHEKIVVAAEKVDSAYSTSGTYLPVIKARLSDDFVEWFSQKMQYTTQDDFNQWFKGLYISSGFGGSTIVNLTDMVLMVHYSFSYDKAGRDTVVHDTKEFYANSEVRQVNVVRYADKDEIFKQLEQDSAWYNYILAPANIYTQLTIPMKSIETSIDSVVGTKRPYVNMAKLRVQVQNVYTGKEKDKHANDWAQPVANMLMIKQSAFNRFFFDKELPSDTCALLGSLTSTTDDDGETIYYYEYDLSSLLTNQLRKKGSNPDMLNMLLVPVDIQSTTSSSTLLVTSVKQQQTISATTIYSASNEISPMAMEVVFSGF